MLRSSMAAGYIGLNPEIKEGLSEPIIPLLMEQNHAENEHERVVVIIPSPPSSGSWDEFKTPLGISSPEISPSGENAVVVPIDPLTSSTPGSSSMRGLTGGSMRRSSSMLNHSQRLPAVGSFSRRSQSSGQFQGTDAEDMTQQRVDPLSSSLWISLQVVITVSQIIASVIVLMLSRDERPKAPLALWIMCYAGGCVARLPVLYWKYIRRNAWRRDTDLLASSSMASASSSLHGSVHASRAELATIPDLADQSDGASATAQEDQVPNAGMSRNDIRVNRFKVLLDCFFAVWFVIGNVWLFAGHSSYHEAPNLYRLCIVFLAFCCINYAMPFVICATVCCCLPCIVTLLTYRGDQMQKKGASPELIAALPIYKFKVIGNSSDLSSQAGTEGPVGTENAERNEDLGVSGNDDDVDSDMESAGEGGIFAPGTDRERVVSAEDAVCCICLGVYKDGVDLKELQCSHFFHVECVDEWLKINATCPLCKRELDANSDGEEH